MDCCADQEEMLAINVRGHGERGVRCQGTRNDRFELEHMEVESLSAVSRQVQLVRHLLDLVQDFVGANVTA